MSRGFSESRMWRVYRTVRSPRATSESCATWVYTSWPKRASSCTASIESTPDSIRSATRSLNSPKSGSRSRGSWREICTPTLPFRIDHEDRRIRGRDAGDPSRLCDRARADLPELLASGDEARWAGAAGRPLNFGPDAADGPTDPFSVGLTCVFTIT